ncbi:hypothetical protein [Actinopolymorpha alba]|uniref:hypothetical protein n=1 Tax=Actinopolymorpha alba TaxID=533267 RepID=UPI0003AB473E|nr:hypothetical protein [Actinopolymorpha alba]
MKASGPGTSGKGHFPTATVRAGVLLSGPLPRAERAHRDYPDLVGRIASPA